MKKTYLGPSGATFSAIAFGKMAEIFEIQDIVEGAEEKLAATNEGIVPLVVSHGGYGVIAMETKSGGRVDPPVNSFIGLLESFQDSDCPIGVAGALRMKIDFALMARTGNSLQGLKAVMGHPKAIGACKNRLKELGVPVVEADSNGKAAEDVARNPDFSEMGALAPMEAATKYGLAVLAEVFQDEEAITTFFMLGPRTWKPWKPLLISCQQRALLVFSVRHVPGALARALLSFGDKMLNLIHVHSLYVGNGHYDFAAELEFDASQTDDYNNALAEAKEHMGKYINFGPFPVL